jgi:hypothetical protein
MKAHLLVAIILSSAFFISNAAAVQVSVTPSHAETEVNQQAWYTIHVYNDGTSSDDFVITVLGRHLEWLNLGNYYASLGAGESKDVSMYFYPSQEGTYTYEVMAYSGSNNADMDSQVVELTVTPEKEVRIIDFTSYVEGGELEIYLTLSSKSPRTLVIPFDVTDSQGNVLKHVEVTKDVAGTTVVEEYIPADDLGAGNYFVRTSMPDLGVDGKTGFSIAPLHRIVTKKEAVSTPFGQQIVLTVTNDGNTAEDYVASDSVQANQYVDFVDAPASTYVQGSDVSYNWRVEGLAVGKSVSFVYNISRLPFLVGSFTVIFCAVALLGMGAVKVRTPNIKKRHVKKRGEHLIILEIRGSISGNLKNVIVKDRISPLGKVVPEFGGPKPVVRESEYGTELLWNLGEVKPRSEIYLSYKIKPLVEAQLKMPRAYLTYKTGEGEERIKVFSREVILEAGGVATQQI